MKIVVDYVKCTGLGMCEAEAPDLFEVQDDGSLLVLNECPSADQLAAAQAAADKRDADVAARMADQAEVDAQLAEATARAKQQEQLVTEMEAGLRDLRDETLRRNQSIDNSGAGAVTPQPVTPRQP
jgi:ferredoxin